MKAYKQINKCRICNSKKLINIVNLNDQYLQGSFIKKNIPKPYLKKIPLQLLLCTNCLLVQLRHTTSKNILYKNYWYESGINSTMRNHLKNLAHEASNMINKKNMKVKVLDIGCNDGTLLNFYNKNFKKFGIDPSQIIKKIKNNQINIVNDFFPLKKKNKKIRGKKFDIITSIAMFYDLNDPNTFVKEIKNYLKKDGIWIFELSYLVDMLKLNSFDTICHEHLEYYSLSTLEYLMKKHNLKIFKVSKNTINGGSIRCFVAHKDCNLHNDINDFNLFKILIKKEKKIGINRIKTYKKFSSNILKLKKNLKKKIKNIKNNNESIFILGASTKGNTILQYLNIDNSIIPFAIERNKEKIGAKTIGTNINIISESEAKKIQPNYKLVLPWHFKKEIINRELTYIKNNGKLIFPLPKILIITKYNYMNHAK